MCLVLLIEDSLLQHLSKNFTNLAALVSTASKNYEVKGRILTTLTLRQKRSNASDNRNYARMIEKMTDFTCDGSNALGITESCDVMKYGLPISQQK